jgi:putative PIN family toxin of toxin-antitoxin system
MNISELKNSKIRVVLDINVILVSISRKSKYRPIFEAILNGHIEIVVSNELINEYVEIIERKANSIVAHNIGETLLNLENVIKVEIKFIWNLIDSDKDDNKFVDCYVSGNSDLLVTNDKHFDILKQVNFPKVRTMDIDNFLSFVKVNF